jgi:hypothetical protein
MATADRRLLGDLRPLALPSGHWTLWEVHGGGLRVRQVAELQSDEELQPGEQEVHDMTGHNLKAVAVAGAVSAALVLLPSAAGAVTGSGGAGRDFGRHHSMHAGMHGGFSGEMNPGVHQGFAGFHEHHGH